MYRHVFRERRRERARVNTPVDRQIRQDRKYKSPVTQAHDGWWHSNCISAEAPRALKASSAERPAFRLPLKVTQPKGTGM